MSILPNLQAVGAPITQVHLPFLTQVVPETLVDDALDQHRAHERRRRKLSARVIVWLVIAMHLYWQTPLPQVFEKLCAQWCNTETSKQRKCPQPSALVYRRYQIGARPLHTLFGWVCRPLAGRQTRGAFLFGLRLMAIDGQVLNMADTPENEAYFGRSGTDRGPSAFPQGRAVYLSECGTHAVVDAGLWPYQVSEHVGARRMLRRVCEGMIVMWDRGLHSFDQLATARQRKAHVLCRIGKHLKPSQLSVLSDGSRLVRLYPSEYERRKRGEYLDVRLIEYTIADRTSDSEEVYRLLTTLLDPDLYPAKDLACAYHERWEIEAVADEIETHQCSSQPVLRSHKPIGVIQEFYGLLIAHYVVRLWMHEAARNQDLDPDRISFTATIRLLAEMSLAFAVVPRKLWPELSRTVLLCIARHRLPKRRHRSCPRVVKRKMSNFPLKRQEHRGVSTKTRPIQEAICLI